MPYGYGTSPAQQLRNGGEFSGAGWTRFLNRKEKEMKHFKSALAVGLVIMISTAGMAFSQGNGSQDPPKFGCQTRFESLDTNHDGQLTKAEFMSFSHRRNNPEQVFDAMDINGQGYITKAEFCSGKGMGRGMGRGRM